MMKETFIRGTGQVQCLRGWLAGGVKGVLGVGMASGLMFAAAGQSLPKDPWPQKATTKEVIDKKTSESPIWTPTGTSNTVTTYPKRAVPALAWKAATDASVKDAANKADAKRRVDATHAHTVRAGLRLQDADGYQSGFYALNTEAVSGTSSRSGMTLVTTALSGGNLNGDTKSIAYINNAKAALNSAETTHSWTAGYGSRRWLRIDLLGDLAVSMQAGTAKQKFLGKLNVTAFSKERTVVSAQLDSTAPPGAADRKEALLEVKALGYTVVNDRITDSKPFTKSLGKKSILKSREWMLGSFNVPFIDWLAAAVRFTAGNVDLTPRIALGTASASAEARLSTSLNAYAEVPLYSLWGFATVLFRMDWAVFDGGVVGGDMVGVAWNSSGKPVLRNAKYAKADYSTGGLGAKVKAKVGFDFIIWKWDRDLTLFYLFRHDGHSVSKEILSVVSDRTLS